MPRPRELRQRLIAIVLFGALIGAGVSALFNAPASAATSPGLGAAASFAILAGTPNITNVAPSDITGDVGLSPATGAGIGLTCAEVDGTIYQVDAAGDPCFVTDPTLLTTAKNNLVTAYDGLSAGANAACDTDYGAVTQELSGLTLVPGVYCANAFQLSGPLPLTLDDSGGAGGVWIFRAELSTLNTTPGGLASVQFLTGDASPCNVWWRVASSASIGSGTDFIGNILALTSISMGTGATLEGRALARNGAVTLDMNTITAEECLPPTGPEATATQAAAATATAQAAAATATQSAAAATATAQAIATLSAQCCGSVDIDNSNSNTIGIDNDNANANANNQDNSNANANSNDQLNNNQNANTQQQDNDQDQSNSNDQTNNIEAGPAVNISGAPGASAPGTGAPTSVIKPPSTGSGGLPWRNESASPIRGLLLGALAGALVAGALAGWELSRARR